jgi:hypothetical protein
MKTPPDLKFLFQGRKVRKKPSYNIKQDLKQLKCEGVFYIQLAQDRV